MPPKNTSPKKPAAKRETVPCVMLRFDDEALLDVYAILEAEAAANERNPTAQARHIIREWAAKL